MRRVSICLPVAGGPVAHRASIARTGLCVVTDTPKAPVTR
jgi:hypothetical protein